MPESSPAVTACHVRRSGRPPNRRSGAGQLRAPRTAQPAARAGEGARLLHPLRNDKTKGKYLHQEPGEPDEAYTSRLHRSTYTPVFRDSIRAFAGLLGSYQVSDIPKTLEENEDNVDMMGSSLSKFLNDVDQMVLRDGGAAILVEMPPEQEELTSALEEIEEARRPYLVAVRRSDVINWRTTMRGGREIVEQAVIRTVAEKISEEGRFGVELEPIYVVLTPGQWQKIRMVKNNRSRWSMEVVDQGVTTLPTVPLVWYGATGCRFGIGSVPLVGLADLSIQHFQFRSDLAELIHNCRVAGEGALVSRRPPALVIGPTPPLTCWWKVISASPNPAVDRWRSTNRNEHIKA